MVVDRTPMRPQNGSHRLPIRSPPEPAVAIFCHCGSLRREAAWMSLLEYRAEADVFHLPPGTPGSWCDTGRRAPISGKVKCRYC